MLLTFFIIGWPFCFVEVVVDNNLLTWVVEQEFVTIPEKNVLKLFLKTHFENKMLFKKRSFSFKTFLKSELCYQ